MTQHAIASAAHPFPSRSVAAVVPGLDETIAAIVAAGRLIADLTAQLATAERSIAALQIDKRALEAELRSAKGTHLLRPPAERAAAQHNRSHLDDALATIAQGLGPSIVRSP